MIVLHSIVLCVRVTYLCLRVMDLLLQTTQVSIQPVAVAISAVSRTPRTAPSDEMVPKHWFCASKALEASAVGLVVISSSTGEVIVGHSVVSTHVLQSHGSIFSLEEVVGLVVISSHMEQSHESVSTVG